MWEYATKRKKKRSSLNQPDSLPLYLSQLLRCRRKSWSPLSLFSSALKEFCQPTPGGGPRFSFQFFLSYFFVVVALNMYLLYIFLLLNERKKEKKFSFCVLTNEPHSIKHRSQRRRSNRVGCIVSLVAGQREWPLILNPKNLFCILLIWFLFLTKSLKKKRNFSWKIYFEKKRVKDMKEQKNAMRNTWLVCRWFESVERDR